MQTNKNLSSQGDMKPEEQNRQPLPLEPAGHGRLIAVADDSQCLNPLELDRLERSFRAWAADTSRPGLSLSRQRILLIFLLIRYTGAKLNEVLALDPLHDLDCDRRLAVFRPTRSGNGRPAREVQISQDLAAELSAALADPTSKLGSGKPFRIDPGFVRRKFYERAGECGLARQSGTPEMIRKSRAVELMQGNMPLPAVQKLLGHSTPNLTAAHVTFSPDDIQQVTRFFLDRESARKTSARNSFIGKIRAIRRGDIQSQVVLVTVAGHQVTTVITNDSLARLGLREGGLITAEVKAPSVLLHRGDAEPQSTAENRFRGTISKITRGKITTEYVVSLADGTELCSVVTSQGSRLLALRENDPVWVMFNCFAVVLHVDVA